MLTKSQKRWNEKLIKALRSGKYKQTRGALLHTQDEVASIVCQDPRPAGYCCLGVACEISKTGEWIDKDYPAAGYRTATNQSKSSAPLPVQALFGFCWSSGHDLPYKGGHHSMMTLNDEYGQSFKQIALRLERWLKKQEVVG